MRSTFVLFLLAISLWSCGESYVLEANIRPENEAWTYQDSLLINIPVEDTEQRYNLYLDVQHSTEFAFQNLYILISTSFPSGKRVEDEVSLELADEMGQWYGKCSGGSCLLRVFLQENIYFKEVGDHKITIEQYMRQDDLKGIEDISFKLAESK